MGGVARTAAVASSAFWLHKRTWARAVICASAALSLDRSAARMSTADFCPCASSIP